MLTAIEDRELISLATGDLCLRATYHRPADERATGRVGVLFVNSGGEPRSGPGNTAVCWAQAFAKRGYPSFRLDLPGLGDSSGEAPCKWNDFFDLVSDGHYTSCISSVSQTLAERYALSGIVVIGHCAGSVSAIFAASTCEQIKGVVALAPYFFRRELQRPALRQEISVLATRNKWIFHLGKSYRLLKRLLGMAAWKKLPSNANLALLDCWKRLSSGGMPILSLNTRAGSSRVGDFDYFRWIKKASRRGSRLNVKFIQGAHHSFADDIGREAVCQFSLEWLTTFFPLDQQDGHPKAERLTFHRHRPATVSGGFSK
jgi:pimeloyl-ACP methyl ester carboxylesterase